MLFLLIHLKIVYFLVLPLSKSVALKKLPLWYSTTILWHTGVYSMPKPKGVVGPADLMAAQHMDNPELIMIYTVLRRNTQVASSQQKHMALSSFFIDSQFQILPTLVCIIRTFCFTFGLF